MVPSERCGYSDEIQSEDPYKDKSNSGIAILIQKHWRRKGKQHA